MQLAAQAAANANSDGIRIGPTIERAQAMGIYSGGAAASYGGYSGEIRAIGDVEEFFTFNSTGRAIKGAFGALTAPLTMLKETVLGVSDVIGASTYAAGNALTNSNIRYEPNGAIAASIQDRGVLPTVGDGIRGVVLGLPGIGLINGLYRGNPEEIGSGLVTTGLGGYGLYRGAVGSNVISSGLKAESPSYGVAFFGQDNLGYYTRDGATIGREGRNFFLMPLEDSGVVRNAGDAARYTGMAPSAQKAYVEGGDIHGLSFPTNGMQLSKPSAADAMGWPHYLEGGNTAVRLGDGPNAGYLLNPTREFVTPGGSAVPSGSVLFRLGPNGEWMPTRRF